MDRNPEYGRPLVGSGFKPLHLLCCLVWSSDSLIGWRGLVYVVIRRFQGSFEVDCTKSTLWKQNPRTFPLLCVHCFAWKPKLFPQQLLIWMRFWRMLESPSRSCVLYSWALNALVGVFQWECVIRFFGVWFLSDSSSGVRYISLAKSLTFSPTNILELSADYLIPRLQTKVYSSLLYISVFCNKVRIQFQFLLPFFALCWWAFEAAMDSKEENKPKKDYKNTLVSWCDLASSYETNQTGSARNQKIPSSLKEAQQTGNKEAASKLANPSKISEKRVSSKSQGMLDANYYNAKLSRKWSAYLPNCCLTTVLNEYPFAKTFPDLYSLAVLCIGLESCKFNLRRDLINYTPMNIFIHVRSYHICKICPLVNLINIKVMFTCYYMVCSDRFNKSTSNLVSILVLQKCFINMIQQGHMFWWWTLVRCCVLVPTRRPCWTEGGSCTLDYLLQTDGDQAMRWS